MPIYLDNSATTPVDPRVVDAMLPYFKEKFANPSSIHTMGREIREDIEAARKTVASVINAEAQEIVFAGSGTESDNLAIMGIARAFKDKGKHIITSAIEHKAVLESCKSLESEGFEVTCLNVNSNGVIDMDDFKAALRDDTILVTIMLANNEIGTIQPIKQIAEVCRPKGIIVHTDAVQAVGKMKIDVSEMGVHLLTFSGHKIYAPKGIGVLYIEEDLKSKLKPMIYGGAQEDAIRPGTENVPYIMGLAKACDIINQELDKDIAHIKSLRDMFESKLLSEELGMVANGAGGERVCSISNITFKHIEGEALMVYAQEVCCSTGSACTSDSVDASHVLYAVGVSPVDAYGSLRFSFGRFNTIEEVEKAADILNDSSAKLRAMSPLFNQ